MEPRFEFKDSLDAYANEIATWMDNHPNKGNSTISMTFEVTVFSGPNRPAGVASVWGRSVRVEDGLFGRWGRKIDAFIKGL